jgi:hypothetical protein
MELSKIFGISLIILILVVIVGVVVLAAVFGGPSCPAGQEATTTYIYNAALKIATPLTICTK